MNDKAGHKFEAPLSVVRALHKLGQDIRDARLRRRIPVTVMAERAGISRMTLYKKLHKYGLMGG